MNDELLTTQTTARERLAAAVTITTSLSLIREQLNRFPWPEAAHLINNISSAQGWAEQIRKQAIVDLYDLTATGTPA